nr:uncharacterized protein LOC117273858 [Nicotiana tomentosiformis]
MNAKMLLYLHCVKELCKKFIMTEFKHIHSIQNTFIDALETLSSMIQNLDKNYLDPIGIKIRDQHACYFHVNEEPADKPWYQYIKRLLDTRGYPENATNLRNAAEATRLLEEIYAGTWGPHINGFTLAKKILRAGYFLMDMENDSICYVQKRHQRQIHKDSIRDPPNELNAMGSPWPFAAWGIDVIGPIERTASNGHQFIFVSINYH